MIDLNQMLEHFIDDAARYYADTYSKYDYPVISSLNDKNQLSVERQKNVRAFLVGYSVLRGLNQDDKNAVIGEIIDFADSHDLTRSPTSEEEILKLFDDLHIKCQTKVHLKKDGTYRDLTSLTSKVLWCCYPDAIPMFDTRAASALYVVSHLTGTIRPQCVVNSRYKPFLSVWLDVYGRVKPTIDTIGENRLHGCAHKVRVLDMILWTIGGPDF